MDQKAQLPTPPTREERRAAFFSPEEKARREAAHRMTEAERLTEFREAAKGWANMWATDVTEQDQFVQKMVACCYGTGQAKAA